MTVGRISTLALQETTLKYASLSQSTLADLQTQLSSGSKSQNFAGIAGQTEQFLDLEGKIQKSQLYRDNNKVLSSRLNSTDNALGQIITTSTDIKNLILLRRNQTVGVSLQFPQQLEGYYNTLANQLNTNSEGRYLFSGSKTDTRPLDGAKFPTLKADGSLDQTYYQGSKQNIVTKVDDGVDLTLNVRADAPGFQKIMQGLALAKQADESGSDADLARAYELVSQGVTAVTDIQALVNANKVSLNQLDERQSSLKLYWQGLKEDIGNTDFISVSTQVSVNQGILQASFSAFAKINALKLSDFLR